MRLRIYILTLSVLTIFGCGQNSKYPYKISDFRPELKKQIQKIISEGQLSYNPDTLTLNFLNDSCTKDELLKLMDFENPLVRVIAYRTIVNRNEPDYFPILLNHLDDTAKVTWWYYDDAAYDFMVSDLMIRKAESERKLTRPQKDSLVDIVLTKHAYLDVAGWMIQDIKPQEKYYSIIKEKSKVETDRCGEQLGTCYALSKFKKKEDLEFLRKIFKNLENPCEDWIFRSIEENPNEIYFPILNAYFNETVKKKTQQTYDDLKLYCRAVAQYKNQNSLNILVALTKKETYPDSWYLPDNKEYVFKAIHKYKSPIYDSLYNSLKPQMSEFVMKYLDIPDYDDRTTW
jgi:hypothetical protein